MGGEVSCAVGWAVRCEARGGGGCAQAQQRTLPSADASGLAPSPLPFDLLPKSEPCRLPGEVVGSGAVASASSAQSSSVVVRMTAGEGPRDLQGVNAQL